MSLRMFLHFSLISNTCIYICLYVGVLKCVFSSLPLEVKERSVMVLKLNDECIGKIVWILDTFYKKC